MGTWYSPTQALGIALSFACLDALLVVLGLAWDGRFFTFSNIVHWFDLHNYSFTRNPIDFLVSAGISGGG